MIEAVKAVKYQFLKATSSKNTHTNRNVEGGSAEIFPTEEVCVCTKHPNDTGVSYDVGTPLNDNRFHSGVTSVPRILADQSRIRGRAAFV